MHLPCLPVREVLRVPRFPWGKRITGLQKRSLGTAFLFLLSWQLYWPLFSLFLPHRCWPFSVQVVRHFHMPLPIPTSTSLEVFLYWSLWEWPVHYNTRICKDQYAHHRYWCSDQYYPWSNLHFYTGSRCKRCGTCHRFKSGCRSCMDPPVSWPERKPFSISGKKISGYAETLSCPAWHLVFPLSSCSPRKVSSPSVSPPAFQGTVATWQSEQWPSMPVIPVHLIAWTCPIIFFSLWCRLSASIHCLIFPSPYHQKY